MEWKCNSFADESIAPDSKGEDGEEDSDSDNEALNELTGASGGDLPFYQKAVVQPTKPTMARSRTFAGFARTSLLPVTQGEPGTFPAGNIIAFCLLAETCLQVNASKAYVSHTDAQKLYSLQPICELGWKSDLISQMTNKWS